MLARCRQTNGRSANILISTMPSSTAGTRAPVTEATVASSWCAVLSGSGDRLSVPTLARSTARLRSSSRSPFENRSAIDRAECSVSVQAVAMTTESPASAPSVISSNACTVRPAIHQRTDVRKRGCVRPRPAAPLASAPCPVRLNLHPP